MFSLVPESLSRAQQLFAFFVQTSKLSASGCALLWKNLGMMEGGGPGGDGAELRDKSTMLLVSSLIQHFSPYG